MIYFFLYLLIVNAIAMLLMIVDKHRARKKLRRISESNLFIVAILGGSLGSIIGMRMVRHKTRHRKFTVGMPLILLCQAGLILWYFLH